MPRRVYINVYAIHSVIIASWFCDLGILLFIYFSTSCVYLTRLSITACRMYTHRMYSSYLLTQLCV